MSLNPTVMSSRNYPPSDQSKDGWMFPHSYKYEIKEFNVRSTGIVAQCTHCHTNWNCGPMHTLPHRILVFHNDHTVCSVRNMNFDDCT